MMPDFDRAPRELIQLPRWVLWRGQKVPYQAGSPRRTASSTDPATWSTFDVARNGFRSPRDKGVGFVLAADDGLACIDIDHNISQEAVNLLRDLRCRYIERSPSGNGLHGWGYFTGDLPRKKGRFQNLDVEIYRDQRYITYTGDIIEAGPLTELSGVSELSTHLQKRTEEVQKNTEDNRGVLRSTEVISPAASPLSVAAFIPEAQGQRNKCLFELARHLKGAIPEATKGDLRPIIQEWHSLACPVVGTKDFSITWTDFVRGWDAVKFPHGETLAGILNGVQDDVLPHALEPLGYGPATCLLVKVCRRLALFHGTDAFYISARQAGELVGVHFTDAAKMLSALVADEVITLVSKGSGKVASRYRWAWTE